MKSQALTLLGLSLLFLAGQSDLRAAQFRPQYTQPPRPTYVPPRPEPRPEAPRPEPPPVPRPEPRPEPREPEEKNNAVVRPAQIPPAIYRAMRNNQIHADRSFRWRLTDSYIVDRFGPNHLFHIPVWARSNFGLEIYFQLPSSGLFGPQWFGVLGPLPTDWMLDTDNLYVVVGDDSNYYLCDAMFPGVEIQIAAVTNAGDDQSVDPNDPDEEK